MDRFGLYGPPLNVAADTSCWKRKSLLCMCSFECVDRPDISVMDSVLIERPSRGVRGLITIMKLITLADVGSIRTCYYFNKTREKRHHSEIMPQI